MDSNNLLKERFNHNMARISGLTKLIFSDLEQLKPVEPFKSDGVRADILRAIVVFLHATFEDVIHSHLPNTKNKSFYSINDIKKALKKNNIDENLFQSLLPHLSRMAERRKRIVHEADLINPTNVKSGKWGIVDDWQLIMWLLVVVQFYNQLRISLQAASVEEFKRYEKYKTVIQKHIDVGNQLLSIPAVNPELQLEALRKTTRILNDMSKSLS
jgi:hypothetical protein